MLILRRTQFLNLILSPSLTLALTLIPFVTPNEPEPGRDSQPNPTPRCTSTPHSRHQSGSSRVISARPCLHSEAPCSCPCTCNGNLNMNHHPYCNQDARPGPDPDPDATMTILTLAITCTLPAPHCGGWHWWRTTPRSRGPGDLNRP